MKLNGYQRQVSEWLIGRLTAVHDQRASRSEALRSEDDVRAWLEACRSGIASSFGDLPRRTPLQIRQAGRRQAAGFAIETLVYESRPGFWVTANLYVPDGAMGAPGILVPCGHSPNGKAWPAYQELCARLALCGFVALIYDPISQGERDQYAALEDRTGTAGACEAHNMMTKQLLLIDEAFATWRAWDGMRSLDVLAARPEVDAERLGITGNSGGGTLTTWIWALDDRLKVAAPSCFITTYLHNLENELPQDGEQYPPGLLAHNLELVDLLASRAPKPVMLVGQEYDFFDRRGFMEAFADLKRVHDRLGAEGTAAWYLGKGGHGFSVDAQEAAICFIGRHLEHPIGDIPTPPTALAEEDLWATPKGQVVPAGSCTVHDTIRERAMQLAAGRRALAGETLREAVRQVLHVPELPPQPPDYRISRACREHERIVARYGVVTAPGIVCTLRKPVRDGNHSFVLEAGEAVTLCLPHLSAEDELGSESWFTDHLQAGEEVYALDIRGRGESLPELLPGEDCFSPYGQEYLHHGICLLLGESLLGWRVYDTLRVLQLLESLGARHIQLAGVGDGALVALFAGLLCSAVTQVRTKDAPSSFTDWALAPACQANAVNFLRGVLKVLDLPDIRRELGERLIEG